MASNGFTYYGATTMLNYLLRTGTVYGKLHVDDAIDGTMNPSLITTRSSMTFAAPDVNGIINLSAPVSWSVSNLEKLWGISIWTAATAGNCLLIREFSAEKPVYNGDTLVLSSLPIGFPVVGL